MCASVPCTVLSPAGAVTSASCWTLATWPSAWPTTLCAVVRLPHAARAALCAPWITGAITMQAMQEHPQSERESEATPQIDTPVIDVQDLEYQSTRVNTAGLKVRSKRNEPHLSEVPEVNVEAHLPV